MAAVPIAATTVGLPALVVALAFLGALLDAPGQTARQVTARPRRLGGVRLERANACSRRSKTAPS